MRLKKYEMNDKDAMEAVIRKAFYCTVAFPSNPRPYQVPMNFAYEDGCIYLHGAKVGEKARILGATNGNCPVSILFVGNAELSSSGDMACDLSANHESVVVKGMATEILEKEIKVRAVNALLRQVGVAERPINQNLLDKTLFIKVTVEEMTGSKRAL